MRAAYERQKLEERIYAPEITAVITKMTAAYGEGTDRLETRSKYFKAGAVTFSALLLILLLVLLFHLQTSAESLSDLNENLELKVHSRTRELSKALTELEVQQQVLAHSAKMSALGEMAGGIAHEINTPLAAITLKAESLIFNDDNSDATVRGLEDIISISEKLAKIVLGLRRFSRDGQLESMTPTAVDTIIDETLTLCAEKFRGQGVELRVRTTSALLINCNPEQISQVLLNLLNNAFDAVVVRDEKWIAVESYAEGSEVCIRVVDSGPGIPREVHEKMMQPFFTTKAVGKGTGIGLSISKGIIERHQGTFKYDAACTTTAFEIRLPHSILIGLAG
jgi:C4-dicarboxylate-specific signal transduction histidine kinase